MISRKDNTDYILYDSYKDVYLKSLPIGYSYAPKATADFTKALGFASPEDARHIMSILSYQAINFTIYVRHTTTIVEDVK